jgi:phage I-like protein
MSKKFSLMDQAKELASEIEIPITRLPSRADDEVDQGREVVDKTAPEAAADPESKPALVEEQKSATTAKPTIVNRRPAPTKPEQVVDSLDMLATEGPDLVPLSCRVPRRVRQVLDERVHQLKAKGKKIKMEDVVTAALVSFLRMED